MKELGLPYPEDRCRQKIVDGCFDNFGRQFFVAPTTKIVDGLLKQRLVFCENQGGTCRQFFVDGLHPLATIFLVWHKLHTYMSKHQQPHTS